MFGEFGGLRQGAEQLQASGSVTGGFAVSGALQCSSASRLPVQDRLRGQAGLGVMVGQQFGPCFDDLWESGFQCIGDALVVLLARALEQRLVGGLLDQCVLEAVRRLWRAALLVQELGGHQLFETLANDVVGPR